MTKTKSATKELREFGWVVGGVLAVWGSFAVWRSHAYGVWVAAAGAALVSLGLLAPLALKPVQKAWMALAHVMGWVMTRVVLTMLFYLVFTPIGLIIKLTGRDLLDRRLEPGARGYWRSRSPRDKAGYLNQF